MATRADPPARFAVPAPGADRPPYARVGVIAAVGFVVGMAWPRLAGIKLVPDPPVEGVEVAAAAPAASGSGAALEPPPAAAPAPAPPPVAPAPPKPTRVSVGTFQVTSCKDAKGNKVETCDDVAVAELLAPRLAGLSSCSGTETAAGTLSLGLDLDLASGKVVDTLRGRSTTVGEEAGRRFLACAREGLEGVDLGGVEHKQARYTVFVPLEIAAVPLEPPPAAASASAAPAPEADVIPASGVATVSWETARVRGTAGKEGAEVASLLRGTRVTVTGRKGEWYRVKYDGKGSEGWVYRAALGM